MSTKTLDNQRLRHAIQCIHQDRFESIKNGHTDPKKDKTFREYRSAVLGAGAFLRQCGVLQMAAFYLSKDGANSDVFKDMIHWLTQSPTTGWVFGRQHDEVDMKRLLSLSSGQVACLETEAEEILNCLKRIVEGLNKLPAPGPPQAPAGGGA